MNRSLLRNPRARTFNARTLNNPLSPSVPPSGQFPQDFGVYFRSKVRPESVFTAMTDPYCTSNDPLRAAVSLFFPLWADYPLVLCCQDPGTSSKVEGELRWCRKIGHELRDKIAILSKTEVQNDTQTEKKIYQRVQKGDGCIDPE